MRSLLSIAVFFLDVWAIMSIINSSATRNSKIIWVLVVAILPVVGFLAWLVAGPKTARA